MGYACSRCQAPVVSGDTYCERCGMQFPQAVPLVSIGEGRTTNQSQLKLAWPYGWRVVVGLIALGGLVAGTNGDIAGSIGFVIFVLALIWTLPNIKKQIKQIKQGLSLATLGVGTALAVYSTTPSGKAAYASYKQHQMQAEQDRVAQEPAVPSVPATDKTQSPAPVAHDPFQLKPGFEPTYQVIKRENMSMASASRWTVRIALPAHLTRKEVEQNLRYAAKEQWDQNQPNALTVFAYRNGSDYEGPITAGQCDYAPYGDWGRASEQVPIDQYKLVVHLEDEYFSSR